MLTSYVYLGQTNAIFADSLAVGRSKGAGVLTFNPVFPRVEPDAVFAWGDKQPRGGVFGRR